MTWALFVVVWGPAVAVAYASWKLRSEAVALLEDPAVAAALVLREGARVNPEGVAVLWVGNSVVLAVNEPRRALLVVELLKSAANTPLPVPS